MIEQIMKELSKPVPKETRQRALELLGGAWRDPGLALPPLIITEARRSL